MATPGLAASENAEVLEDTEDNMAKLHEGLPRLPVNSVPLDEVVRIYLRRQRSLA